LKIYNRTKANFLRLKFWAWNLYSKKLKNLREAISYQQRVL